MDVGFPGGSDGKESTCKAGDEGLIPELGRSPREGNGNSLQYSCLENPHGQRSLGGYSPSDQIRSVAQSCTDSVTPWIVPRKGSSVHGIFQARILEWVAISFSRGSSQLRHQTCISCSSCIGRQILYEYTTWEALKRQIRI